LFFAREDTSDRQSLARSDSNMAYKNENYYKEWYLRNRKKRLEYLKEWRRDNPDKVRKYNRDTRIRNPKKAYARDYTKSLIRAGKISRGKCAKCGKPNSEAHHKDYNKPDNIEWLCTYHHKRLHNLIIKSSDICLTH